MTEPCIVRPGPSVARGLLTFTVRVPGLGTPLRFTRGTIDERRLDLAPAQVAALREAGYEVEPEAAPAAEPKPKRTRKKPAGPAEE